MSFGVSGFGVAGWGLGVGVGVELLLLAGEGAFAVEE